ncbi:phosphonate C-P lyase system protein PhnH [Gordonia sp. CPCC 206044]|uniref:phosphonate C-P lyase system protein PhnH n=1 Tax=Gordonia sp. CPCC 206044 TaxID=3140793 RepID=UPI003AF344F4
MTSTSDAVYTRGFHTPVSDAQHVFRSVLDAMARPTTPHPVHVDLAPPPPLGTVAAAVVLTLCDEHTPLWLDTPLRSNDLVAQWIRFHTGAPVVDDAAAASFALASGPQHAPALDDLDAGSDMSPHASATLIIDIRDTAGSQAPLVATGPGVPGAVTWDGRGLPPGMLSYRADHESAFPQGIDLILADHESVSALPRTTRLESLETRSENV